MTSSDIHTSDAQPTPRIGRPRSAESHRAIIEATLELLADEGFAGMSMEGVAARAGVGKATIYRRWDSKTAMVADALSELEAEIEIVVTDNVQHDLEAIMKSAFGFLSTPLISRLLPRVIGELVSNPEFFQIFAQRVIRPRVQRALDLVEAGRQNGQIRTDVDPYLIITTFIGSAVFHIASRGFTSPDPDFPERLIPLLMQGIGTQKSI